MLDYHLHLWPHGSPAAPLRIEELAAYCERAQAEGVEEIAVTEHFFRFAQADGAVRGFWDDDAGTAPALRADMAAYWDEHVGADLDDYAEVLTAAKQAGLPIVIGLEVDYYPGRMDAVADALKGYPFDVLLGSVHWLGAWGFDYYENPVVQAEWERRTTEEVWRRYTEAVEELAASGVCDVLAHPDLCKVTGRRPAEPDEFYDRLAEAAASSGMAVEVSSAGWRKPVQEAYPAPALLSRLAKRGVPVTTASDAHRLADVGHRMDGLRGLLNQAGIEKLAAYRNRQRTAVPVG